METVRAQTTEAKSKLDETHLSLRNLEYEQRHRAAEIASCRSFRSGYGDEEIGLAPSSEASPSFSSEEAHILMLERLNEELRGTPISL